MPEVYGQTPLKEGEDYQIARAHHGLLDSKLAKKASTKHGATHTDRRNNPRLETNVSQRPTDKVSAEAGLHAYDAARKIVEDGGQRLSSDLLTRNRLALSFKSDQVERILANVDTDDGEVFKLSCSLHAHGYYSFRCGGPRKDTTTVGGAADIRETSFAH